MIEKLFPIDLPPGYKNNGTKYQSKNRWYKGNLVRFFQGNKQPVGGWVQRTTTGATISGTPNAAVSWETNTGATYLAIGTTSGLYVVSATNVVYDVTPATAAGDGITHLWQLDIFGAYLVAVFNRTAYLDTSTVNAFVWRGSLSTLAEPMFSVTGGPGSNYGVCVTPERFLFVLRGADPVTFPARGSATGNIYLQPPGGVNIPVGPVSPF